MARLRPLKAQEVDDPELRAAMEKVGDDVALGIYGHCPELFKPFRQFLGRAMPGDALRSGERLRQAGRFDDDEV